MDEDQRAAALKASGLMPHAGLMYHASLITLKRKVTLKRYMGNGLVAAQSALIEEFHVEWMNTFNHRNS